MLESGSWQKENLAQLDRLIQEGSYLIHTYEKQGPTLVSTQSEMRLRTFVTHAVVVIEHTAGKTSQFYNSVPSGHNTSPLRGEHGHWIISTIAGVVFALRTAVNDGLLVSLESTLRASIHEDFLVQASELLDSGYYVPAFMLTSAVLENHLDKMTQTRGLPVTGNRSLAKYNDLLRNDSAYNQWA